jgi:hypothetical protein
MEAKSWDDIYPVNPAAKPVFGAGLRNGNGRH